MQVSERDLFVNADDCVSQRCSKSGACDDSVCRLCKDCLSEESFADLKAAYLEHTNKHTCKRLFPPGISVFYILFKFKNHNLLAHLELTYEEAVELKSQDDPWSHLSSSNAKMHQWFLGKCLINKSWCH